MKDSSQMENAYKMSINLDELMTVLSVFDMMDVYCPISK